MNNTLSSSVPLFLQVDYPKTKTTFNKPVIFKRNKRNLQAHIYTTYNYVHQEYDLLSISKQYTPQHIFITHYLSINQQNLRLH